MSEAGQIVMIWAIIGLVIGGVAALAAKGAGLLLYIIGGVVGALSFPFIVPRLGIYIGGDPWIRQMAFSVAGAIIFVVAVRLIIRPRA